jgi:multiple sugar transport system permease protein
MKINLKEHLSLTEKRNAKSDLLFSRKRNRRRCAAFRNTEKGLAFILPSFAGVCIFWLIPYVDVIRRSFCGAVNGEFVGIENYRTIFANKAFRLAAGNTLRFFGVCVPLLVVLSLIIAVLLAGQKRFTQILKSFFLLPMAIPVASVVLLWRLLFDDQGLLNHLLHMLSVQTTDWMNTGASFYVLVISYIWRNLGYDVVLWMAGLSAIPAALYEAAKVDGANCFQKIRYIILPSLRSTIVILLLFALGGIVKGNFGLFYNIVGTNSLLYDTTDIIETYVYRSTITDFNFSTASAVGLYQSIIGFCIVMASNFAVKKIDPEYALF